MKKIKLISKKEMRFFMSLDFIRFMVMLNLWLTLILACDLYDFFVGKVLSALLGIGLIYHLFQLLEKWFKVKE